MGQSSTHYDRTQEGFQVDPKAAPRYFHNIDYGSSGICSGTNTSKRIDSAMSAVRISVQDAKELQEKLQGEYFTKWKEDCDVNEFHGYELQQLDPLLNKISDRFKINGVNIYNKICGIRFCQDVDVKIYEFTFGEDLNSGKVHFGMAAISKSGNSVDAVTCLYTLDFTIARTLVTKKKRKSIFGINAGTDRRSWYENKSLGFVTRTKLINFCRYKALTEFKKRNLVSSINDVKSLAAFE